MKKILVTGGSGFIGTNLVSDLLAERHSVLIYDKRKSEKYPDLCIVADVRDKIKLADSMTGVDVVYHLAAEYGRWNGEAYYENLWQTNVIGTKHMLRFQEKFKFRMIFFSSAEVYGDYGGRMTESVMEENKINAGSSVNIKMASGGGWAAIVKPKTRF